MQLDSRSKSLKETKSESGVFSALEAEDKAICEIQVIQSLIS